MRRTELRKLEQNVQDIENAISESETNYRKEELEIRKIRNSIERTMSQIFDKAINDRRRQNTKCVTALQESLPNVITMKQNIEDRMRGHEDNRYNYSN